MGLNVFTVVLICACVIFLTLAVIAVVALVKSKSTPNEKVKSLTRVLFLTTQVAAIGWVSVSYIIAGYATVYLGQPFPVVDLSQQVITTILGVNVLKVVENIFEHNDGKILGTSNKTAD